MMLHHPKTLFFAALSMTLILTSCLAPITARPTSTSQVSDYGEFLQDNYAVRFDETVSQADYLG